MRPDASLPAEDPHVLPPASGTNPDGPENTQPRHMCNLERRGSRRACEHQLGPRRKDGRDVGAIDRKLSSVDAGGSEISRRVVTGYR